jgi:hypothetical protein
VRELVFFPFELSPIKDGFSQNTDEKELVCAPSQKRRGTNNRLLLQKGTAKRGCRDETDTKFPPALGQATKGQNLTEFRLFINHFYLCRINAGRRHIDAPAG